jgi:hypothetical protein
MINADRNISEPCTECFVIVISCSIFYFLFVLICFVAKIVTLDVSCPLWEGL